MISVEMEKLYPSGKTLVKEHIASRIHAKDASVYDFSDEALECARNYMGWTDLASNPPCPFADIRAFAREAVEAGMTDVVLIGQGGSTQASMTITKYNKVDSSDIRFRTLDSDSPVRLREVLAIVDPKTTMVVISSKSGGTVEPRLMLAAVREAFCKTLTEEEMRRHLVAITDPGSELERQAREEGWRAVFSGEPTVGGRYSALSVFGLLPAALVGIDIEHMMACALEAERACSEDSIDNPAIGLASFLYDNYLKGRNKFSVLTQKRGRVLGLWIEQLVAESLGKEGQGILPNIEVDSLLLSSDPGDRSVVMYQTKNDSWDEMRNFEMSLSYVDPTIPRMNYRIESVEELAEHFVVWEYAIAMCGYLMKVCPFDQPDVASAKSEVLNILENGEPAPDFVEHFIGAWDMGEAEVRVGSRLAGPGTIRESLRTLLGSIEPGDFFALNAFLPFTGEGRREALEVVRHGVAEGFGVVSCLEVGPRYLHSTGQLQKGGRNDGVFLILSADELKDIPLRDTVAPSLGALAKAQAVGDFVTLSSRDRRVVHLHLPDNSGVTLRALAAEVTSVVREIRELREA
ncbi:glucose-6-phosphate isomerase [Berryella intestinalis]|uniref:Glucose-6-phosphate isomerase n=1 Tax=Berryella intestinalis TaxID=1531429 RepID=A0A0A8B5D7_9ACTN|nr:glucose-6-phosphate isomerase [Berryella intestinalis]AJC12595.1 glucose-6-phosphate isomerase [Berryella intestinalis]